LRSRQKKKKYKKLYGHNPINHSKEVKVIIECISTYFTKSMKLLNRIIEDTKIGIKNIKEMPEDEFNQKIMQLDPEQIALAKLTRYGNNKNKLKDDTQ